MPFPVPVKGLMVNENIAQSPPGTALALDNWIPEGARLRVRKGSLTRNTGLPSTGVKSLMVWTGANSSRLFAAAGSGIYDITTGGAVGAPVVTGVTNVRMRSELITTAGGWFLSVVNGVDPYRSFDGTSWSTPAVTGVTSSTFSNVFIHASKLFFIQKNTLRVWYLTVDSIAGAAVSFDFGASTRLGGFLVSGVSSSLSAGDGVSTYVAVITSQGEIVVYRGANPASAADWAYVGTYRTGKPLGNRCFQKVAGDVLVMTEDGISSLTQIMQQERSAVIEQAITRPIAPLWRDFVRDFGTVDGWEMTLWTREGVLLVSLPSLIEREPIQYVASVGTGAWSRFYGWNCDVFTTYNGNLIGGFSDGKVKQCDVTARDDGVPYYARVMPVYQTGDAGFAIKTATAIRINVRSSVRTRDAVVIRTELSVPQSGPSSFGDIYSGKNPFWNQFIWNQFDWGPRGQIPRALWKPVYGVGSYLSPDIVFMLDDTADADLELNAIDMIVQNGGLLT
jgi:hypothetical protein